MVQLYTCNRCGKKLDYQPTNERGCGGCGYPLDVAEILNFLKANQNRIQKVECAEFLFSDGAKEITVAEAFRRFDEGADPFSLKGLPMMM